MRLRRPPMRRRPLRRRRTRPNHRELMGVATPPETLALGRPADGNGAAAVSELERSHVTGAIKDKASETTSRAHARRGASRQHRRLRRVRAPGVGAYLAGGPADRG